MGRRRCRRLARATLEGARGAALVRSVADLRPPPDRPRAPGRDGSLRSLVGGQAGQAGQQGGGAGGGAALPPWDRRARNRDVSPVRAAGAAVLRRG